MIAEAKTVDQVMGVITSNILQPFVNVLIGIAFIYFLFGVSQFILNAGDEEAREKGKRHMIWGILGLVIMIGVNGIIWVLINFVGSVK